MLISMQRRMASICRVSNVPRYCLLWRLSIVVICSQRTMLPSLRNADGGTGYCPPACLPYNAPYTDNGVSQNDAVIYAVEILLPDGNFAILSGWLCDLSRNGFRLIGNAVSLHQQPAHIDAIQRTGFIGCSFSYFRPYCFELFVLSGVKTNNFFFKTNNN